MRAFQRKGTKCLRQKKRELSLLLLLLRAVVGVPHGALRNWSPLGTRTFLLSLFVNVGHRAIDCGLVSFAPVDAPLNHPGKRFVARRKLGINSFSSQTSYRLHLGLEREWRVSIAVDQASVLWVKRR